jgi:hypothetical protein
LQEGALGYQFFVHSYSRSIRPNSHRLQEDIGVLEQDSRTPH